MSRRLTFWTDQRIELIQNHFIAVAVPTWVSNAKGPVGQFLRKANLHEEWITSSGYMDCVSASGKHLGGKPCEDVLEKFRELPENERAPGAVEIPDLKPAEKLIPSPPEGGLVLRVYARFLSRAEEGRLRHVTHSDFPLLNEKKRQHWMEPNTDYMWFTREERESLIPDVPETGRTDRVRPIIAERIARFHLNPQRAMTDEGHVVRKRSVQAARLSTTVRNVTPRRIQMDLNGFVHWGSDFDPEKATTPNGPLSQGFQTRIYGRLEFDRKKEQFTQFDVVAPGHVWGRWGDANGKSKAAERPGRTPFGFAFELATGDTPTDRMPPGGNARYAKKRGYFGESR